MMAGGELENIEMERNPLYWLSGSNDSRKRMPYEHCTESSSESHEPSTPVGTVFLPVSGPALLP